MAATKRTVFNTDWLKHGDWSHWLSRCVGDIHSARCSVCFRTFSLSNMGKQAVVSHATSANHVKNMSAASHTPSVTAPISCQQPPVQEGITSTTTALAALDAASTNRASGFSMSSSRDFALFEDD